MTNSGQSQGGMRGGVIQKAGLEKIGLVMHFLKYINLVNVWLVIQLHKMRVNLIMH